MKDFLDYISGNPLYGVIVIVLFILACKSIIEFYQWVKKQLTTWYNNKRTEEKQDENIRQELDLVKKKLDSDYIRIQKAESHLYTIQESINELKEQVETLNELEIKSRINTLRNNIVNAVSSCIDMNKPVSADFYNQVYDSYTEYEDILEKNGLTNGKIEMTMTLIKDSWMKRAEAGMFSEQLYLPPAEAKKKLRESSESHIAWWDDKTEEV